MDLPDKSRPPATRTDKKIEAVIPTAVPMPRPATRRFFDYVFAESPRALGAKIGRDVVVPRLKAGVEEALNSFIAGAMWGGGPRPMSNIVQGAVMRSGGINYASISSPSPATQAAAAVQNNRVSSGNYQDLVVPTQQYAETLLAHMYDLYNQYRIVTVADLYELANMSPSPSDNSYGWLSLEGARISKVREGFVLELPRPGLI